VALNLGSGIDIKPGHLTPIGYAFPRVDLVFDDVHAGQRVMVRLHVPNGLRIPASEFEL